MKIISVPADTVLAAPVLHDGGSLRADQEAETASAPPDTPSVNFESLHPS